MPKALTEIAVAKIKPELRRKEIPDGLLTGLYLVVQPSGKKSWAARYRSRGAPRKMTLGAYPALSLADARKAAKVILADVASGSDPAALKQAEKAESRDPARSFETAVRRYIVEFQQRKGNRTWKEPARQLGLISPPRLRGAPTVEDVAQFVAAEGGMVERWGARPFDSITAEDILAELDRQAPVQANRVLATFRTLWKFALSPRVKLATSNPLEGIAKEGPERSRDRVLSDEELRKVWFAAEGLGQPWTALLRALMLTGQRRDEIAQLPWSELDLSGRKWVIPAARAKNGSAHLVHLSPELLYELSPLTREGEFVFTRGVRPVGDFTEAKMLLDKLSGVTDWVFHDLRRTMATRLNELGIASAVVDGLLNHKSGAAKAGVSGTYNRANLEAQRYRALLCWGRYVAFIVDEKQHSTWLQKLQEAEDEYETRLEMADACLAGGVQWGAFHATLQNVAPKHNVVPIKGLAS